MLRPEGAHAPRTRKGIATWPELEVTFTRMQEQSANTMVLLETDMRTHTNPTRMEAIRLAAEDLAQKLRSLCPSCGTPGFWKAERVGGLPCSACGAPAGETRAEIHGCLRCAHRITHELTSLQYTKPASCENCNP